MTYIITLDKERNENECLHEKCGPQRSKLASLARKSFAIIFSNRCSFVDYIAHNLESFVVPLMMIRKIHKKTTDTSQKKEKKNSFRGVGGGGRVGDTHFYGNPIGGDTHITVTPGLGDECGLILPAFRKRLSTRQGSFILNTPRCNRR